MTKDSDSSEIIRIRQVEITARRKHLRCRVFHWTSDLCRDFILLVWPINTNIPYSLIFCHEWQGFCSSKLGR